MRSSRYVEVGNPSMYPGRDDVEKRALHPGILPNDNRVFAI
jgi:hypothetical protein